VKVGDKAPAFTLTDQAGKERSLDEFLKNGPVAVVFYRSARW
jgi:peroxiredoxin